MDNLTSTCNKVFDSTSDITSPAVTLADFFKHCKSGIEFVLKDFDSRIGTVSYKILQDLIVCFSKKIREYAKDV